MYFLRKGVKLHFYSLGTVFEENIWGVQRDAIPWLWVSNRGESIPVGTRFCLQSLVCYTFCAATQWHAVAGKGLSHARQTLFGGSRTGGFCGLKATKDKEFAMSKIRLFGCSWHRKPCSEAERFSVTTGAQEVYKNPPQRSAPVPYSLLLQLKGNRQFLWKLAHREFQNLTDCDFCKGVRFAQIAVCKFYDLRSSGR